MALYFKGMLSETKLKRPISIKSCETGKFDSTVCINCPTHVHTQQLTAHLPIGGLFFVVYTIHSGPFPHPPSFSFTCGKGVFAKESLGFYYEFKLSEFRS